MDPTVVVPLPQPTPILSKGQRIVIGTFAGLLPYLIRLIAQQPDVVFSHFPSDPRRLFGWIAQIAAYVILGIAAALLFDTEHDRLKVLQLALGWPATIATFLASYAAAPPPTTPPPGYSANPGIERPAPLESRSSNLRYRSEPRVFLVAQAYSQEAAAGQDVRFFGAESGIDAFIQGFSGAVPTKTYYAIYSWYEDRSQADIDLGALRQKGLDANLYTFGNRRASNLKPHLRYAIVIGAAAGVNEATAMQNLAQSKGVATVIGFLDPATFKFYFNGKIPYFGRDDDC